MSAINAIQDLWVLFAAVLAAGFVAGWLARELLLRVRRKPILDRLYLAQGTFIIDEKDIKQQVEATEEHIALMRSISENAERAAELTSKQMEQFLWRFYDIYGENKVPNLIEEAREGVRRLSTESSSIPSVDRLKPSPPRSPSTAASS